MPCTKSPQGWSAGSFAVLLALLAAGTKPLFWVRPDYAAMEYGVISPNGLLELGNACRCFPSRNHRVWRSVADSRAETAGADCIAGDGRFLPLGVRQTCRPLQPTQALSTVIQWRAADWSSLDASRTGESRNGS